MRLSSKNEDNAHLVIAEYLGLYKAKVTNKSIQESLESHPDYPSILSLSETLNTWKVENVTFQIDRNDISLLEAPFLTYLNIRGGWFALVTKFNKNDVVWFDTKEGFKTESIDSFIKNWTGIILIAEPNENSGERDYLRKYNQEKLRLLRIPFIILSIISIIVLQISQISIPGWDFLIALMCKALGLFICILLIVRQFGNKNALIDKVCNINDKTNCDSVLNSPGANLWGVISWSEIGLIYFAGGLFFMIFSKTNQLEILQSLSFLTFCSLPFIIYSIYYQAFIIKKWCFLCLSILIILVMESITNSYRPFFEYSSVKNIIISFLSVSTIWFFVRPFIEKEKEYVFLKKSLQKLKNNYKTFIHLLNQQQKLLVSTENVEKISLGNCDAKSTITIVINPYCDKCIETYFNLKDIIANNQNIKGEIIFIASNEKDSLRGQFVRLLFSQDDKLLTIKNLDIWFSKTHRDLENWKRITGCFIEKNETQIIVKNQINWCIKNNITKSPTIFFNVHRIPEIYKIEDLRSFNLDETLI